MHRKTPKPLPYWSWFGYAIVAAIFALALFDTLTMYNMSGAEWDFAAHWLSAKALITSSFYSALFSGHLASSILYANAFYFEPLRAPLTALLMVPFAALGNAAVPAYYAFALILLVFSAFYAAKRFKVDFPLLEMLVVTPYAALILLMLNGTEIISMSLLLIFVSLLLEEKWSSGAILAIAALAKYPNLIFLPMLFLLPKKMRPKAFLAFALATLPWLLFNEIVFHNPIFSYLLSAGTYNSSSNGAYLHGNAIYQSLLFILPDIVPAFLIAMVLVMFTYLAHRRGRKWSWHIKRLITGKGDRRSKTIVAFLSLGILGWGITSVNGSINNLPRLGYLIYTGMALLLAVAISELAKNRSTAQSMRLSDPNLYYSCIVILAIASVVTLATWYPYTGWKYYGSFNSTLASMEGALPSAGIGNCSFVSNEWVMLVFNGYKAHFPYYYNYSVQHYPIVIRTASDSSAVNFANVTKQVYYNGFFIAFPKNYTC